MGRKFIAAEYSAALRAAAALGGVRGAVARAAGHLRVLSFHFVRFLDMVAVIESDGAELQQLHTRDTLNVTQVAAVLAAAPQLQVLNADVLGECTELLPLLRNDPPYGQLRVRELLAWCHEAVPENVLAFAAAVQAHESLRALNLEDARFARGLNALLDAATERRVFQLAISSSGTTDVETVPALARLLQCDSLTHLNVYCDDFPHQQEASVPVLCAALRACHMLTDLALSLKPDDGASHQTVAEVLDAAASLPALSLLDLQLSRFQDRVYSRCSTVAAGGAFGALLRADLPSLHTLRVDFCSLGDEGLAALLDGLAANTHALALFALPSQQPQRCVRARPAAARDGGAGGARRA
jgi:hypothetical protein